MISSLSHGDAAPAHRPDAVALAAVCFVAFLAHARVLGFGFAYDDFWTILENTYLHGPRALQGLWDGTAAGLAVPDAGRPVMVAVHWAEWRLFGAWAPGYHLVSLLLHVGATALWALVASSLLRSATLGLAAALLFALHPLQEEAVSVVSFREDLLVAFLGLAFWLAALSVRGARGPRRLLLAVFSGLCLLLAVGSKESGAALLVSVPVATALAQGHGLRRELRAAWPVYLAGASALAAAVLFRFAVFGTLNPYSGPVYPHPGDLWHAPLSARLDVAVQTLFLGWQLLWTPVGLSAEYCTLSPTLWAAGFGLLLLSWGGVAVWTARRPAWRAFAAGFAWFLVTALPTSNLFWMPNTFADRFWYVPSLGWALGAAALVGAAVRLSERWLGRAGRHTHTSAALWVPAGLWAAVLAVAAWGHGRVYRNDDTLWEAAYAAAPCQARAVTGKASVLFSQGRTERAEALLTGLLSRRPYPPAFFLLGRIHYATGAYETAAAAFAAALSAGYSEPWRIYLWHGRAELAQGHLERARRDAAMAALLAPLQVGPQMLAFDVAILSKDPAAAGRRLAQALRNLFN